MLYRIDVICSQNWDDPTNSADDHAASLIYDEAALSVRHLCLYKTASYANLMLV